MKKIYTLLNDILEVLLHAKPEKEKFKELFYNEMAILCMEIRH